LSSIQNLQKVKTVKKPVVSFLKDGEAPTQLGLLEKPLGFETDSSFFYWTQISRFPHSFSPEERYGPVSKTVPFSIL
jgi:hypothetical protein